MKARQWFRVENQAADPAVAEIHIIDFIGSWDDDWFGRNFGYEMGVTARAFVEALAQLPAAVTSIQLHINSPGGDVQAGVNIANALREQQTSKGRTVETYVDGIAASIASVIAMAGSKVHIGDNALMMIHNPFAVAMGTAGDMRKTADILDAMRGQIINTYQWHSSMETDAIAALMDAETWMDADAAIANGFATDKVEGLKAAASIAPGVMAKMKVPEKFKARVDALLKPVEPTPAQPVAAAAVDVLARVQAAGLDLAFASSLVSAGLPLEQVTARIETAKAEKAQATARTTEIRALASSAKQTPLGEKLIAGGVTVDAARDILWDVAAVHDAANPIDGSLAPENGKGKKPVIDTAAIYAARNNVAGHK